MKIIHTGNFRSSDFYSAETSPRRAVVYYELEYYSGGEGFSVVDGIKYPHSGCHFLLAKPGSERFSIGRFDCLYVHFESDEKELSGLPTIIPTSPESELSRLMSRLIGSEGLKRLSYLCELLVVLTELGGMSEPDSSQSLSRASREPYMERILATKEYMEQNFGSRITLDTLSGIAYLSKNFYRTVFCRIMEVSPREYLKSIRVARALELLRQSPLGYSEIAQLCGFENQSYMNYVLKSETGLTPSQIRYPEKKGSTDSDRNTE